MLLEGIQKNTPSKSCGLCSVDCCVLYRNNMSICIQTEKWFLCLLKGVLNN